VGHCGGSWVNFYMEDFGKSGIYAERINKPFSR
jgi:hypothetical protein